MQNSSMDKATNGANSDMKNSKTHVAKVSKRPRVNSRIMPFKLEESMSTE